MKNISIWIPIVVGIVMPILIGLFVGVSYAISEFVILDTGSEIEEGVSSGIGSIQLIFGVFTFIWLIAGIVWTIMVKNSKKG